jgi:methionyl-tRNA formyltransferase
MKKILFVGTTVLSYNVLNQFFVNDQFKIVGILTGEEEFRISYSEKRVHNISFKDLTELSNENRVPKFVMKNGMNDPQLGEWIESLNFDYIVVIGWYHMIPRNWIRQYICLGIHASLLPNYRGGAPLVWAILNGENETGVTLFQMDQGVDTGPVIAQIRIPISNDEDISTLMDKVTKQTIFLCMEVLPNVGIPKHQGSNELTSGSHFPQRKPENGKIEGLRSLEELSRFIRAQTHPYPGAYLENGDTRLYLWKCRSLKSNNLVADIGKLVFLDDSFGIQCLDGILEIREFTLFYNSDQFNDLESVRNFWKG